jgi:hypothetical protein
MASKITRANEFPLVYIQMKIMRIESSRMS